MRVSNHAIRRYQERIENCSGEQARMLLLQIVELGHTPTGSEWGKFSVAKEIGKKYVIYGKALAIVDVAAEVILTVLKPHRNRVQRVPQGRGYRRERTNYQEGE